MSKKFLQAAGIVAALGVAALPLANTFAIGGEDLPDPSQTSYGGTDTLTITIESSCGVFDLDDDADDESATWTGKTWTATMKLGELKTFNEGNWSSGGTGEHELTIAESRPTEVRSIVCNSPNGATVYAQGGYFTSEGSGESLTYTFNRSTYLENTGDDKEGTNILTGTNTNGDNSSWAFKMAKDQSDYAMATIEDGYDDYVVIPEYKTAIITTSGVTGNLDAQWAPNYQVYIGLRQEAGTYTGHVTYAATANAASN